MQIDFVPLVITFEVDWQHLFALMEDALQNI